LWPFYCGIYFIGTRGSKENITPFWQLYCSVIYFTGTKVEEGKNTRRGVVRGPNPRKEHLWQPHQPKKNKKNKHRTLKNASK